MRYFSGVVSGVLLTILVVFLIDQVRPGPQIVNWNVLSTRIGEAKEEVRQDLPGSIEVAKNMFKAFYGVRSAKPPEQKRIWP